MSTVSAPELDREDLLAPAQRLHVIAELLAEGVRRQHDDAMRIGHEPHLIGAAASLDGSETLRPYRFEADASRNGESR